MPQAEEMLRLGKATALLDESLVDAYDHDEFERVVLAAKLCINHDPRFRPEINLVSPYLASIQCLPAFIIPDRVIQVLGQI